MKESRFQDLKEWYPFAGIDTIYDIYDVSWTDDGITFALIPDSLHNKLCRDIEVFLCWQDILSYQITKEILREDCWIDCPQKAWSFYEGNQTLQLLEFRKNSGFFPNEARHFVIIGTTWIADIFATEYPKVKVVPMDS